MYNLNGQDNDGNPAALPVGATVTITPDPGVTLDLVASSGVTLTKNGTGYVATITAPNVTVATIRLRITGPLNSTVNYATHVPGVDPVDEDFPIKITSV